MPDRFEVGFQQRIAQSEAAINANLAAFRAATATQSPMVEVVGEVLDSNDSQVRVEKIKSSSVKFSRKLRGPALVVAAGMATLAAAACTNDGSSKESVLSPNAAATQTAKSGAVLGEKATPMPMPSVSVEFTTPYKTEHRQAPDFTLNDVNGVPVSLHDFGDRPVILELANPCVPCYFESDKLAQIQKQYAAEGLVVLNISTENARFNREVRLLLDPGGKVIDEYELQGVPLGVPATVFIRGGKIVYAYRGFSQENDNLDKYAAAFMTGQDMDSVLPTATPNPTVTPLPTRAPESEQNDSAEVVDLGNFDLGVVGWQEFTNVKPNERYSSDGKSVTAYTKHVVIRTIARNKTDKWQEFTDLRPNYDGYLNVELDDKNGNQLDYGPGSIPVVMETIVPLDYEGVFSDPFVPYVRDGTNRSVDYLYQPEHRPLKLIPPGFGLPIFIDFEIPVQVNDYNLKFGIYYKGKNETKVVEKGQKADNFGLIAPNAKIFPASESLDVKSKDVADYSIKILGSTKGNMVPGTAPHDLLLFDVTNRMPLQKYPFGLSLGLIYLKDGRVVSLEKGNPSVPASSDTVVGMYLGTADPHKDFSHTPIEDIDRTFDFDLKGAVLVLGVLGDWKAWQIPEGTNVPIGNGGE